MLGNTLRRTFWVTYDHLGKLILANLVWALALIVPGVLGLAALNSGDRALALMAGAPMVLLVLCALLPVMSAGLAHMVKELIDTRDGSVRDLFVGIRLYWRRALGVGFSFVLATVTLSVSVWFYATKLGAIAPWAGYAISGLALWCLAFVMLMAVLVLPALVQKKAALLATLKLSAVLVLDNPLFCIGLAIQFLALAGLSLIPPVFFLFSGSLAMVLASSAYEELARKYARLGATKRGEGAAGAESGLEKPHLQGPSRRDPLSADEEEDDYLNRGFRDFLFPWKG